MIHIGYHDSRDYIMGHYDTGNRVGVAAVLMAALAALLVLGGCGALEPKYFPTDRTITSTFFPSNRKAEFNEEFEARLKGLYAEADAGAAAQRRPQESADDPDRIRITTPGRVMVVYTLAGVDTSQTDALKRRLQAHPMVTGVTLATLSSLPDLNTLRIMAARQKAEYALVLNAYSNVYVYHNAWTVPTIFTLGLGYFFLPTHTVKAFVKVEYSLLDVVNNVIMDNDAAMAEATDTTTLPESGVIQYKVANRAIAVALKDVIAKFSAKL